MSLKAFVAASPCDSREHAEDSLPAKTVGHPGTGLLTLTELATELRCSKAHLSHIINGKVAGLPPLPVARIGRRVIVRREVFLAWLSTIEARDEKIDTDLNPSLLTHGKE